MSKPPRKSKPAPAPSAPSETPAPTPHTPDPTGPAPKDSIAVTADPPTDQNLLKTAARLSIDHSLRFLEHPDLAKQIPLLLVVTPDRLELRTPLERNTKPIAVDLAAIDIRSSAGRRLSQPIAKAVGIRSAKDSLTVIDATAGFGEDSWILAALGCRVLAVERNRVVATLLRDGLFRMVPHHPDVFQRLTLLNTDARHMLRQLARRDGDHADLPPTMQEFFRPDVVYLDPMFAGPRKGAQRRPMVVLRQLVGEDIDAAELFDAALRLARRRVVVKRPLHAPPLAPNPVHAHKGASIRWDVYSTTEIG